MAKMIRFSVSIDPKLLERFDEAMKERRYKNRSKAIRDVIVDFLVEREWEKSERGVMGSLTLLYKYETKGLLEELVKTEHEMCNNIISTMHVHIDEHNCMEILAIKGQPQEIRQIADRLISCKGVKHGKLVMTTTGKNIA
jgi:CopG family nickel-responsive transcriptional regulator